MRRRTEDDLNLRNALRRLPTCDPRPDFCRRLEATMAQCDASDRQGEPHVPSPRATVIAPRMAWVLAAGIAAALVSAVTVFRVQPALHLRL